MASETTTPTEDEFVMAIESGPLTEVEIRETPDGTGLIVAAVALDPDTADEVPVSITLDPEGETFVVTIATDEILVPRDQPVQNAVSPESSGRIGALQKLHDLATRLEQEAKGKAREIAERLRLRLKHNG